MKTRTVIMRRHVDERREVGDNGVQCNTITLPAEPFTVPSEQAWAAATREALRTAQRAQEAAA